MGLIYPPKGEALEYCDYGFNPFVGCRYQCSYCYNNHIFKRFNPGYDFSIPKIKPDVLGKLRDSLRSGRYKGKEIFLSFATDIFQGLPEFNDIAKKSIETIIDSGSQIRILTKSGYRSWMDEFVYVNTKIKYGVTLTIEDSGMFSKQYEPFADPSLQRIYALQKAKECGYYTWVSLEPIIIPHMSLLFIEQTHTFVDEFKLGKWNYSKEARDIDWYKFANEAVELLVKHGKDYYIKKNLRKYL